MGKAVRNDELIDRVVDYIREHPEEWDQSTFASHCRTTACFAGHAMLLSGYALIRECIVCASPARPNCENPSHYRADFFTPSGGKVTHFDEEANMLLGLLEEEGHRIYYSMTESLEELEELIAAIRVHGDESWKA